jgi:hypothetical protein
MDRDARDPDQAAADARLAPRDQGDGPDPRRLGRCASGRADDATLDAFEAVLAEADHDLYSWVSGQAEPPASLAPMLARIAAEFRPAQL